PSESHQLFISLNAPMKNSLTAPSAIPILSFTFSKAFCILATAKNTLSIVSSLKPIDDNISAAPMWSPLNIAMTPSNAVTTLSLNSIADCHALTNLSFNPSIKLRNVSDLLYAMTKPAPSAAIPAIVKVIGLVRAPNNGANHLSSPPALVMEAINGASAAETPAINVIILPTTSNTGPAETATTPNHFCQPAIGRLSHISPITRLIFSENVPTELQRLLNRLSMFAPS